MDGNTQSTIAVLGHPIAGNPSQFALERVLQHLKLDWRVFSFDVPPEHLHVALAGLEVLGVRGVLVDHLLTEAAASWKKPTDTEPSSTSVDCFHRGEDRAFIGVDCQRHLIGTLLREQFCELEDDATVKVFVAGDLDPTVWQTDEIAFDVEQLPADLDRVPESQVIVVADQDGQPADLDADEWPADDDQETLVIDFSEGHPDWHLIESKGYKTFSAMQRRIATLGECFLRWSGEQAPSDIMYDAIEEYLSV